MRVKGVTTCASESLPRELAAGKYLLAPFELLQQSIKRRRGMWEPTHGARNGVPAKWPASIQLARRSKSSGFVVFFGESDFFDSLKGLFHLWSVYTVCCI